MKIIILIFLLFKSSILSIFLDNIIINILKFYVKTYIFLATIDNKLNLSIYSQNDLGNNNDQFI